MTTNTPEQEAILTKLRSITWARRAEVDRAATEAIMERVRISEDQAMALLVFIALGEIPNVSIEY